MGERNVSDQEIQTHGLIDKALHDIYAVRPGLKELLQRHGTTPLEAYSANVLGKGGIRPEDDTHPERISHFADIVSRHAGILSPSSEEVAGLRDRVRNAVLRDRVVNTGPHHGIFAHPFFAGDLVFTTLGKGSDDAIVAIGDGSTPLGNLTYPAGIFLTETRYDKHSEGPTPVRLHLSPSNLKSAEVAAAPFDAKALAGAKSVLGGYRGKELTKDKAAIVSRMVDQVGSVPGIFDANTLGEQVTMVNALLYPKMFSAELRESLPIAVTLDSDPLMAEALADLLESEEAHFSSLLFDPSKARAFTDMANNLGVVSSSDLFYTTDVDGGKVAFELSEDGTHISADIVMQKKGRPETVTYPLTKDAIISQLRNGNFYPAADIQFAMLAFYGVDCLGGFNQSIGYLPEFYKAYAQELASWGDHEEAQRVMQMDPLRISTTLSLAFVEHTPGKLEGAGLLDLAAKANPDRSRGLTADELEGLRALPFDKIFKANIPNVYRMVVPKEEQSEAILALTVPQIAETIGIADKLVVVTPR